MKTDLKLNWNLNDILDKKDFEKKYLEISNEIKKIDEFGKILEPDMSEKDFRKVILFSEEMEQKIARMIYLPHLMLSTDQKNQEALMMEARASDLIIKYSEKIRKINHWIKGKKSEDKKILDELNAKRLFKSIEDLEYVLKHKREAEKYTLKESEENIVENKNVNGIETIKQLRRMMETDFEYEIKLKNKKTKIIKTQSELMVLVHDSKAEIRKAAYLALFKKHKENIEKLFLVYKAVVKDWDYEAKLRKFESPIGIRNFYNDVPDKTIGVLLDVCFKNKEVFQRFFKFKAKEMKIRKLSRFDLYAPTKIKEKEIELEKAKQKILEVFSKFSPKFFKAAKKIIEEKHIDYYPRKEKRSGAFCATVGPEISPYVLLNYTGKIRDVFTLAHELGHGIHSICAEKHLPSAQQSGLPLAETASTLAEMILFENIFENETDKEIRKSMLMEKMADSFASILRQSYFVLFEMKAHELISKGTTPEELSDLYLELLREQFGNSVEIDSIFKYEWAYIPHIVDSPFYCYAYSFGELLSYALFAKYKKEGKKFVEKIEKILEIGGSKNPTEILSEAGIDINDPNFWQESFEIIKSWQYRLDQI